MKDSRARSRHSRESEEHPLLALLVLVGAGLVAWLWLAILTPVPTAGPGTHHTVQVES